jgi:hypothetical protein
MTKYSHPKCYAKKTKNCSTKISGEHIISDNILELFEHEKKVKIAGLPWNEHQKFNLLSRKALVANILCTDHNNALSPYDTEAGKLFRCIKEFDSDFNNIMPKSEYLKLNGHYIEKWMLKIVCGLIASKQISLNGIKTNPIMKDIYIDLLFNNANWPKHWGLYFKIPDDNQIHKFDCVGIVPLIGNNEVKVAKFLFNNFKFNLVLGNPDQPDFWGIHRINKIHMTDGNITKTITFEWENPKFNNCVTLKRTRTTRELPVDWDEWMKK